MTDEKKRNRGCNLCEAKRKYLKENQPDKYDIDLMNCIVCGWSYAFNKKKSSEKIYTDGDAGIDEFLDDVIDEI